MLAGAAGGIGAIFQAPHEAIRDQPVTRIPEDTPFGDLVRTVTRSGMSHFPVRVHWNDTLQQALDKMAAIDVDELPVAREETPDEIMAMISKRDIVDYYYGRSML